MSILKFIVFCIGLVVICPMILLSVIFDLCGARTSPFVGAVFSWWIDTCLQ